MIAAAQLHKKVHHTLSAGIACIWTSNTAPLATIGFVETFLNVNRKKLSKAEQPGSHTAARFASNYLSIHNNTGSKLRLDSIQACASAIL